MTFRTRLSKLKNGILLFLFRLIPVKKRKILMWNGVFREYGCNPKYITEYLLKHEPGKYDIVWAVNRGSSPGLPDGVRRVDYFSNRYLYEISTAGIIISNIRTSDAHFFEKRNGQFYIQTWHSSLRLKKIEGDAADRLGEKYVEKAKADSAKTDLIVSGCDFSTRIFECAFWYDGRILKSGTPRCDILFSGKETARKKVRKALGIEGEYILYAPTFRDGGYNPAKSIDARRAVSSASCRFGGKWNFVYRFHPNIADKTDYAVPNGINGTLYPDIQELVAGCGMLITDYSSCMFDASLGNIPCVLYQPDLTEYLKRERGLYFEMSELPFPSAVNEEGLYNEISEFDVEKYSDNTNEFASLTGSYEDGHSCERIFNIIEERTK